MDFSPQNKKKRKPAELGEGPLLNIPHIKNDAPLNKSQVVVACHVTGIEKRPKDSGRTRKQ